MTNDIISWSSIEGGHSPPTNSLSTGRKAIKPFREEPER